MYALAKIRQVNSEFEAGVAPLLCNGLPPDGPGFDSRWERCKYRASRLSQGTVNGGADSK